jgi:hypothetical protein
VVEKIFQTKFHNPKLSTTTHPHPQIGSNYSTAGRRGRLRFFPRKTKSKLNSLYRRESCLVTHTQHSRHTRHSPLMLMHMVPSQLRPLSTSRREATEGHERAKILCAGLPSHVVLRASW